MLLIVLKNTTRWRTTWSQRNQVATRLNATIRLKFATTLNGAVTALNRTHVNGIYSWYNIIRQFFFCKENFQLPDDSKSGKKIWGSPNKYLTKKSYRMRK